MTYRYNPESQIFEKEEEDFSIPSHRCAIQRAETGKGALMNDGAAAMSRQAALRIASANGQITELLPCERVMV